MKKKWPPLIEWPPLIDWIGRNVILIGFSTFNRFAFLGGRAGFYFKPVK